MLSTIIFNVEHGQSIFFAPYDHPEYGMLVDCGNTDKFNPIDIIDAAKLLPVENGRPVLGNLLITNYDHDHFSGLPYLMEKARIKTVRLAKNITSEELVDIKEEETDALKKVCHLKDTYTHSAANYNPPYSVQTFSLERQHLSGDELDTNNLSQVVFVTYGKTTICIAGDLEEEGWNALLKNESFRSSLLMTDIFVAAHHGRENGYAAEIFTHCFPEVVIMSDKRIVHGTQEGMASKYANHVDGDGVNVSNLTGSHKVLTTRKHGHIVIHTAPEGGREYKTLSQ